MMKTSPSKSHGPEVKTSLLNRCLDIARAYGDRHPEWGRFMHYSFVIEGNKLVAWATNRAGPPQRRLGYRPSSKRHAEPAAWAKARGLLEGKGRLEVVNIRLNRLGDMRISAPCACCHSFLSVVGVEKVWFTTDAGFAWVKCAR